MPTDAMDRVYEWVTQLPPFVVLPVMWVAGAVLEVMCVAAIYAIWLGLARLVEVVL
jgi:hypothetical protein